MTTTTARRFVRALLTSMLMLVTVALIGGARPASAEESTGMGHSAIITGHAGSERREAWGTCHSEPDFGICAARTMPDAPADRLRLVRDERVGITFESEVVPTEISVRWGDGEPMTIDAANPTFTSAAGLGDTDLKLHAVWRSGDVVDDADWTFVVTVVEGCDRSAGAPATQDVTGYDADHDGVCDVYLLPPVWIVRETPSLGETDVATTPTTAAPVTTTTPTPAPTPTIVAPIPVEVEGVVIERPAPMTAIPVRPLATSYGRSRVMIAGIAGVAMLALGVTAAALRRRLIAG